METFIEFTCQHAQSAHWIIFLLLMLAGLNLPISEDILLLSGGVITSVYIPEKVFLMYAWIFAGCWLSAWEAYGIGRHFGPKLFEFQWFKRILTPKKIDSIEHYCEKFGIFTFIIGRFIPGGVRNALFMTSGLIKMPFLTFIVRDGIACLFSSATIFYLGFRMGENYQGIAKFFYTYNRIALIAVALLCIIFLGYRQLSGKKTNGTAQI